MIVITNSLRGCLCLRIIPAMPQKSKRGDRRRIACRTFGVDIERVAEFAVKMKALRNFRMQTLFVIPSRVKRSVGRLRFGLGAQLADPALINQSLISQLYQITL